MGGEVSTDFKSSNGIEISRLVQVLLNFDWFRGFPPWGGGGWVDVGGGWWEGAPHTHAHARTCVYDIIGKSKGFPQWGQPFAWNYHVYHACMCVRAHACIHVHVYMCGGTPEPPPTPIHPPATPIHPLPHPKSCREPKTPKFNKSWTNRDNSILFEDFYLWTFLNSYRL